MLRRAATPGALRRFSGDERGAVVVDQLPVLLLALPLVLLIFEIGIAYFLNLGTAKAAKHKARMAVTLSAVHPDVPMLNAPASEDIENGVWCYLRMAEKAAPTLAGLGSATTRAWAAAIPRPLPGSPPKCGGAIRGSRRRTW